MNTVTISKAKFDLLERRSKLYTRVIRKLPERKWGIEEYSSPRIEEFMRVDKLNKKTRERLEKMLA